jgi:hypothetical protein
MGRGKGKGRAKVRAVSTSAPPSSDSVSDSVSESPRVSSPGVSGTMTEVADVATASLDQLKARYPDQWEQTGSALVAAIQARHAAGAATFLARARAEAAPWRQRMSQSGKNPRVLQAALPALVRERMSQLAVKEVVEGAAAVRASGQDGATARAGLPARRLRFGLWSGALIQRLFFRAGLERKPVSMSWFKLIWPLVTEQALLMPLCQPQGIYCFYTRPLIEGLATLIHEIGPGPALEIAAGDGTLSRFLNRAGTPVQASDDHSWSHSIAFPPDVERLDANAALGRHNPRVVLCSWPPPGNRFERSVFRTATVDRYVVITTRHRFAAGDWSAYADAESGFDRRVDERLSRLVLPPEVDPVVLIFDRR